MAAEAAAAAAAAQVEAIAVRARELDAQCKDLEKREVRDVRVLVMAESILFQVLAAPPPPRRYYCCAAKVDDTHNNSWHSIQHIQETNASHIDGAANSSWGH